ncbi:MAG: helix-turn-helix domain-containing protein, partial [Rhodothermales bacterium]|nr:helix-turn-helix domain-containing protein [Rhodothermales bacterium]
RARDLLATQRYTQAVELLRSVDQDNGADADGLALTRALSARAALMDSGEPADALEQLGIYRDRSQRHSLDARAKCEVSLWLGLALAIATEIEETDLALCLLTEANGPAVPRHSSDIPLWSSIGRALVFNRRNQRDLAGYYAGIAASVNDGQQDSTADAWRAKLGQRVTPESAVSTSHALWAGWRGTAPLLDLLQLYVDAGYPVVLFGEPGVGKEHTARQLHARCDGSITTIAVLDRDDLTSTDRVLDVVGSVAEAAMSERGWTVVLTNIDSLAAGVLAEIPRVATYVGRRGGRLVLTTTEIPTTVALPEPAYRILSTHTFEIPPLRRRTPELPALVRSIMQQVVGDNEAGIAFTDTAIELLADFSWPGNLDQLRRVIEDIYRSAAIDPLRVVDASDLEFLRTSSSNGAGAGTHWSDQARGEDLSEILQSVERDVIIQTLAESGGHVTAAARALGLSRQGLYKKMKRLDIDPQKIPSTQSIV